MDEIKCINPKSLGIPTKSYSQGVLAPLGNAELLFVTGQLPQDANGNVVVWKTSTFPNIKFADGHSDALLNGPENRAMELTLTGTVKDHGEYKGTKQTEVLRVKLAQAV